MYRAIDNCPKPVIARIHGAALGGGAGLAAVCDVAIAADDALFGFTEVKLGIIPAVISPFVLAKIGASHARALFLTGERFDAQRAKHDRTRARSRAGRTSSTPRSIACSASFAPPAHPPSAPRSCWCTACSTTRTTNRA